MDLPSDCFQSDAAMWPVSRRSRRRIEFVVNQKAARDRGTRFPRRMARAMKA